MKMETHFDEILIILRIQDAVAEAGSRKELAKQWGISQQYLSDLLRGRREASDRILDKLGLIRVVIENPYL